MIWAAILCIPLLSLFSVEAWGGLNAPVPHIAAQLAVTWTDDSPGTVPYS